MINFLTVLSARASYSRVRSVLLALKKNSNLNSHVVLVASAASAKFGKLENFLSTDGIKIDWKVESQSDTSLVSSMVRTTANSMTGISDYIINNEIDGTLIIADRHETIAGSIASAYLGLKTFHLLGGEISGNIDNKVRYANSFLSDFHFVATEKSRINLENCGIPASTIFNTGCPSLDFIPMAEHVHQDMFNLGGVGIGANYIFNDKYIVVLQHSETTSSLPPRLQVRETIEALEKLKYPTLWIWPNSDQGSEEIIREINQARENGKLKYVHFERSIDPILFLTILKGAQCIIGNSSVAIRECSLLGIPAVNIGGRQNNRECAENVLNVDYNQSLIGDAILTQIQNGLYAPSEIYGDGKAGQRISDLISELIQ